MNVYIVWESMAEKGEKPDLVDVFATPELAREWIGQQDEDAQECYDVEEREVQRSTGV